MTNLCWASGVEQSGQSPYKTPAEMINGKTFYTAKKSLCPIHIEFGGNFTKLVLEYVDDDHEKISCEDAGQIRIFKCQDANLLYNCGYWASEDFYSRLEFLDDLNFIETDYIFQKGEDGVWRWYIVRGSITKYHQ